jgi:subtilase family serine protease
MLRFAIAAALGAAAALCASASAQAQVFASGAVFHVRACGEAPAGVARCHAHMVSDARGSLLANRFKPNRTEPRARSNVVPQGYGPSDLRSAYGVTTSGSASTTIAIVDAYGYPTAEADLGVYRSAYGLPACTTANGCFAKVNERGQQANYPRQNVGWDQEQALDVDMASAMCPNCKIILVEATSASYIDLATAENLAASLGAHVISNSYGGGEMGTTGVEPAYNHPGVAITVSTGDSGYGAQFPATSPHVIAVGGTSLTRAANTRGWAETAWSGGGSGCSSVYAKPIWQHDPLCTTRMEADISAVGDPYTGVAAYAPVNSRSSAWLVFGGTSVGAPLIGGIFANNGGAVVLGTNPYAYAGGGALNDVTGGGNGNCGGTYFCAAGPGYDGPTGLGTPQGTTAF